MYNAKEIKHLYDLMLTAQIKYSNIILAKFCTTDIYGFFFNTSTIKS